MARPEDDSESLDELERRIRRELDQVELALGAALDSGPAEAAERLETLEALTARLETALADLGAALGREPAAGPTDLNRLASRALEDVLVDIEKPLLLRTAWCEALPQPTVSPDPLLSLITRVLTLVGRFAYPGDLVKVSTDRDAGDVRLRIELQPVDLRTVADTTEQLGLREGSLAAFVADLGGRFAIVPAPGPSVAMELRLPVGAAQP